MGAGGRVLGRGARGGGGVCKLYRKKLSAGKLLNGSILLKTQMVDIGGLVQYYIRHYLLTIFFSILHVSCTLFYIMWLLQSIQKRILLFCLNNVTKIRGD